jgi:hypothetical protein
MGRLGCESKDEFNRAWGIEALCGGIRFSKAQPLKKFTAPVHFRKRHPAGMLKLARPVWKLQIRQSVMQLKVPRF